MPGESASDKPVMAFCLPAYRHWQADMDAWLLRAEGLGIEQIAAETSQSARNVRKRLRRIAVYARRGLRAAGHHPAERFFSPL